MLCRGDRAPAPSSRCHTRRGRRARRIPVDQNGGMRLVRCTQNRGRISGFDLAPGCPIIGCVHVQAKCQTGSKTMTIWKTAIACSLAGAVMAGQVERAAAGPMPTNVATMKAAVGDDVTQVYWRGRGFGWGIGGLAAGAVIGGGLASRAPCGGVLGGGAG